VRSPELVPKFVFSPSPYGSLTSIFLILFQSVLTLSLALKAYWRVEGDGATFLVGILWTIWRTLRAHTASQEDSVYAPS